MKKYLLLAIILLQTTILLGQSPGTVVKSKTIYSSNGLTISYSITFYGNGDCNDKPNSYYKKYRIDFQASNTSSSTIKLYGSRIDLDDNLNHFRDNCWTAAAILLGSYPGFEYFGTLEPNEKRSAKMYCYMLASSPDLPYISSSIIPIFQKDKQPSDPPKSNPSQKDPGFSDWKKINSSKCDVGIEYSTKRVERFQLNYQLWFYYKVRNTSNKNIRFDFHLTRNGKKEFGRSHTLSPGGVDEWMHKMSANYIDGVSVTNVINTATNKGVCDENSAGNQNNTSANTSNNQSNPKDYDSQINKLLQEKNELCQDMMQEGAGCSTSICLKKESEYMTRLVGTERQIENRKKEIIGEINRDIYDIKAACGGVIKNKKTEAKRQKAEEERLEAQSKMWVQKTENFTNLINEGDQALKSNNFNEAISKYTEAKNLYTGSIAPQEEAYAKEAVPLANARIAVAQKAKADAARKIRVEEKQKVEKKQNDATLAAATSYVGMMALVKDAYSPHWFAAKFQVGLGYGSTGIISNSAFYNKSSTKSSNQYQFRLGFKFGFANNKGISLHLNPLLDIGVNAYQLGIDGSSTGYGGTGTLFLGKRGRSKIKLFAEAGYLNTSGSYNYDQAVAEGRGSTSDNVENATYKFSTIKYGGGIMFHFISSGEETFIKPGIFFEKPSFAQNNASPVMVGNLQVNVNSTIIIDFSYSKNYLIGGQLAYPFNFTKNDINFWSIKLIRQGKLR